MSLLPPSFRGGGGFVCVDTLRVTHCTPVQSVIDTQLRNMKVFKLLVKIFFLATVVTTVKMSGGFTNNNNTVMYDIIAFCWRKHPVHSRTWSRQAKSNNIKQKVDAFEVWAPIHGANLYGNMNGLLTMKLTIKPSHRVGIYGSGEPGTDFSLPSTIQHLKDTVQRGENKTDLDASRHVVKTGKIWMIHNNMVKTRKIWMLRNNVVKTGNIWMIHNNMVKTRKFWMIHNIWLSKYSDSQL